MQRKGGSSTAVVTAIEIRGAMAKVKSLATDEEKVVRMRYGVPTDLQAPLPRAAGNNTELADELLFIEMQLMRAFRARQGLQSGTIAPRAQSASSSDPAMKNKIVRALRKKK